MQNGLVYGFVLDGQGGGRAVNRQEIETWTPEQGALWVHLDYTHDDSQEWVLEKSGLPEVCAHALITDETRPRATRVGEGLLIALRGVNLNPSSQPEDMVSIRLFIDGNRIISTRRRRLLTTGDLVQAIEEGRGPRNTGDFLAALTEGLTLRMESTIDELEERADEMEEFAIEGAATALRTQLSALRREAIILRRYLAPQREALSRLYSETVSWLGDAQRMSLRETSDALLRMIEDLDSARDRAAVVQEELVNQLSEQMNLRMYVLSLVAAVFLPLGFLTGLLGINVGGIPGAENPYAFFIFIGLLIMLTAGQVVIFRKMRWM